MRYSVNLLSPKEQNFADKIIYFSFNYLRYILVITQLVVIGVFFYRFKIDQEIVDLKDNLKQKGEIIAVSSSLVSEIQTIDTKLKSITEVVNGQEALQQMYTYFLSTFPQDFYLTKLELDKEGIKMEGFTQNAPVIRLYYNRLLKDKQFQTVTLDNLKKNEVHYTFAFTLTSFKKNTK